MSSGGDPTLGMALACLAGAMPGFLPWNALRARMFMGNTGSTWLGLVVAAFSLHANVQMSNLWSIWMTLPAYAVTAVAGRQACMASPNIRRSRALTRRDHGIGPVARKAHHKVANGPGIVLSDRRFQSLKHRLQLRPALEAFRGPQHRRMIGGLQIGADHQPLKHLLPRVAVR